MKYTMTQSELEATDQNPWLTDRERTVFDLYYRRGWHIEDVAAEIDRDRRTVNRILHSVRQKARNGTRYLS